MYYNYPRLTMKERRVAHKAIMEKLKRDRSPGVGNARRIIHFQNGVLGWDYGEFSKIIDLINWFMSEDYQKHVTFQLSKYLNGK